MKPDECRLFEFGLTTLAADDILQAALASEGLSVINTLNAHSFNVSLGDEAFHQALLASDWLVADGVGVVWAAKLGGAKGLNKVSGFDLFQASMKQADAHGLTVGFLGSSDEVLARIRAKCERDFTNAVVRTLSPPFADAFSETEVGEMLDRIGPVDILFVGMTAPKQEKFVLQAREHIRARAVLSIGAVFDFYAETSKRPHPLFIKLGLEWLGRSLADPKRLGKRNLVAIPTFVFNCLRKAIRG